jgi:HTH-type transcriptional regulator/antitoxin HipB
MIIHSPRELALYVSSQRKKLKLSQATVASLVGLKQKTISAFENKPESIKLETLFLILSAVNTEVKVMPKNKTNKNKKEWNQEW